MDEWVGNGQGFDSAGLVNVSSVCVCVRGLPEWLVSVLVVPSSLGVIRSQMKLLMFSSPR